MFRVFRIFNKPAPVFSRFGAFNFPQKRTYRAVDIPVVLGFAGMIGVFSISYGVKIMGYAGDKLFAEKPNHIKLFESEQKAIITLDPQVFEKIIKLNGDVFHINVNNVQYRISTNTKPIIYNTKNNLFGNNELGAFGWQRNDIFFIEELGPLRKLKRHFRDYRLIYIFPFCFGGALVFFGAKIFYELYHELH